MLNIVLENINALNYLGNTDLLQLHIAVSSGGNYKLTKDKPRPSVPL